MTKMSAILITAIFFAASSLPAHALMRTNTLNPDYKFGKYQAGAASHNADMTKTPKAKRKPKVH